MSSQQQQMGCQDEPMDCSSPDPPAGDNTRTSGGGYFYSYPDTSGTTSGRQTIYSSNYTGNESTEMSVDNHEDFIKASVINQDQIHLRHHTKNSEVDDKSVKKKNTASSAAGSSDEDKMKLNSQSHPEVRNSATFYVIVREGEGISEAKFTNALQSWISKEFGNQAEIEELQLNDDVGTVKVTPAEVLETILSKNTAEIKKRETSATVEFCRHRPKAVRAVANFAGSALSQEAVLPTQVEEADVLPRCVTKMETSDTMKVPLVQYWYLNQVYRDEMKQIQEKHDVDIDAEVSVSIKAKKGTSKSSLNDANQEFVDLFQKSTKNLISCPSDTIYRNLSQLIEVLKTTPDAARLMFNVASEHLEVFGPEEHINTVQKMLGVQPHSDAAGFEKQERSRTMEIDISRSFLNKGLSMNQTHWDLMQSGYKKQVEDIEEKFGVVFKTDTKGGRVKVKAMSNKGQVVCLESHALRALMHAYQKAAVMKWDKRGTWGPIGSQEHVGFATDELKKMMGGSVFDKDKKHQIGYPTDTSLVGLSKWDGAMGGKDKDATVEENCPICLDKIVKEKKLVCNHKFCSDCLQQSIESMGACCPVCKNVFGKVEGTQPEGTMKHSCHSTSLTGYPECGTIVIQYSFPSGVQTTKHPHPGKHYNGTNRTAYLPDNKEGREVHQLLKRAFDQKLIFTVGTSRTTGTDDCVTWNDIHHKTSTHGGSGSFGYPDPEYLLRVKEELKAKGIE
ncbi:E3 ubiquitin-protein ligase DTX3L isoform X2 [Denticeps clupeoides]|uniref:E3 ubiquitin-protein ligase DTX3L isoform X2 n=1 Tax=Denticeps clupeoides TaxID=299321 RepID=UPI0010A34E9B|nr:E3 ubiquitin-protein ligase DTX3L-like isoform X2 [Denticeps clupeoides]